MKIGKYLTFHFKALADGKMPTRGLCNAFKNDKLLLLFDPEHGDCHTYWATDGDNPCSVIRRANAEKYGNLRQTIVLLMAAMNGEL
jgi:hypothetical protein